MTTEVETPFWSTFVSDHHRDLEQADIDQAIQSYSEFAGAPRYAAVNPRYRDTLVQEYFVSIGIIPRFANGVSTWEIWLSTKTLVLTGEGKDLSIPRTLPEISEEEWDRFKSSDLDGIPIKVRKKGEGAGRGRAKIMHNGTPRDQWIQQEFAKGRNRRDIADELGVRYQIIFAATKGMKNGV